ncbi:MAG: hypothetical protein ACPHL6_01525 [Rubripirellula sp.]
MQVLSITKQHARFRSNDNLALAISTNVALPLLFTDKGFCPVAFELQIS